SIVTFNGQITGNFQMEFNGASGTNTVSPNTGIRNSYGSTKISTTASTTTIAGNANAFSAGPVLMNAGTMRLNNFSFDFAGLNSTGIAGTINNNGSTTDSTMTLGSGNGTDNYSATLANGAGTKLLA